MAKTFGFPRSNRLLTAADFRTVFDDVRVKAPSDVLLLLARPNEKDQPRLGFILSKKNIKHAVQRNRVKRFTREYLRCHQQDIPPMDIIFMGRKGLDNLDDQQLHQIISKQFKKLVKRASKVN
jgi:ribonuclease P protein component